MRQTHGHLHMEQHRGPQAVTATVLRRAVAAIEGELVGIEPHAEARRLRQLQFEVAVLEALHDDVVRQQQRAEQFRAPGQRGTNREHVRSGDAADLPSSNVPP